MAEICIDRAVEILKPGYGTGYRIGGGLVLTAAHLIRGREQADCVVRDKQGFGEVKARLAWMSDAYDVALLELPEAIEPAEATGFGRLSSEESIVPFEMYAWPRWAWTRGPRLLSGGRHILGRMYLADQSPEKLLVIEPDREAGVVVGPDGRSPWEGASGASVFSGNRIVAVQRQHQNPRRLSSLEAEPIEHVVHDEGWISTLQRHGVDSSLRRIGHLDEWLIDSDSVFERVQVDRFVGRRWLTARVDRFMEENECGYLVVQGRAGTGKSAYLAHLARRLEIGCATHFMETTPGRRGVLPALRNLTAQVVNRFGISQTAARGLLSDLGTTPDYLERLLRLASEQDSAKSMLPFVCIVDGLNESDPLAGSNALDLPARLPPGFFVIASTQPVAIQLQVYSPLEYVSLEDHSVENREDIIEYVRDGLTDVPPEAVEAIVDRAEDNWAYVFFVTAEIEAGLRSASDIDQLPRGIWQYYARFWASWRGEVGREVWVDRHLPLLTAIAAAREVLPIPAIAEMCGADASYADDLLSGPWLRFVVMEERKGERTIRPFNSSLVDFVHGQVDEAGLSESERAFIRQLQDAVRSTHHDVANRYLTLWGDGLDSLRTDRVLAKADAGYGWRNTVAHLLLAKELDEAMNLIRTEWTATYPIRSTIPGLAGRLDRRRLRGMSMSVPRNAWFESHLEAGDVQAFFMDLDALLQAIHERRSAPSTDSILDEITVLGMRRCALEVLEELPSAVVVSLARHGDWSVEQILQFTNRLEDPATKARLLVQLIEVSSGELVDIIEVDALEGVLEISDTDAQLELIEGLLPHLHGRRLDRARNAALQLLGDSDLWPSQALLSNILDSLQPTEWDLFEDSMTRIPPLGRLRLILALLSRFGADAKEFEERMRSMVNATIEESQALGLDDTPLFEVTCLEIATRYPGMTERYEPSQERALHAIVRAMVEEYANSSAYVALARLIRLDPKGRSVEIGVREIDRLVTTNISDDPMKAIHVVQGVTYQDQWAAQMLGTLVDALPDSVLPRLQKQILGYKVPFSEYEAFQALAMRYLRAGLAKKALQVAKKIPNQSVRHRLFAHMAEYLEERDLERVQESVVADWADEFKRTRFPDPRVMLEDRARSLGVSATGIAPRLAQLGHREEALALIDDIAPQRQSDEWSETISNTATMLDREGCMKLLEKATKFGDLDNTVLLLAYLSLFHSAEALLERLPAFRLIGYFDVKITRVGLMRASRSRSFFSILNRTAALEMAVSRLASLGHVNEALQEVANHFAEAEKNQIGVQMPHCVKSLAPRLQNEPEKLLALIGSHRNEALAIAIRNALPHLSRDSADVLVRLSSATDIVTHQALCLGSQLSLHPEDRRHALADQAFELTQGWVERERIPTLGFIAPYSEAARNEILGEEIEEMDRVQLFQDALWNTEGDQREEWLGLARENLDHELLYGLANYLPNAERDRVAARRPEVEFGDRTLEAIAPAIAAAGHPEDAYGLILGITDIGARVRVASSITEELMKTEPERLANMCRELLARSDAADRKSLYNAVVTLAPVLFVLGGDQAILELEQTIIRGLRWWSDFATGRLGAV